MVYYEHNGKVGRPSKVIDKYYSVNEDIKVKWHLHILFVSKPMYSFREEIKKYIDKNWNEVKVEKEKFNYKKIKDKRITNLGNFIMIINIFCFIFIYEHSIFTRIQNFSSLLFLFYYMFVLNQLHVNDKKMKVYSFLTYVIMFSILIISLTRGNISSLKFFIN